MGKRVFLVRHAKALKREEWKGDDCKRPLTEEGVEEFERFLSVILPVFPKGVRVVSSPCERALKTAEMIASKLGVELVVEELLSPDSEPEDYERVVKKYRGNLILVGHEPDISLFLNHLTCLSPSRVKIKKGCVVELVRKSGKFLLYGIYNPRRMLSLE